MKTKQELLICELSDVVTQKELLIIREAKIKDELYKLAPLGIKYEGAGAFSVSSKTTFDYEKAVKELIPPFELIEFEKTEIIPEQVIKTIDYEAVARARNLNLSNYKSEKTTLKFIKEKK
jgi:hypothetical protein